MATPGIQLLKAIENTISKLESGSPYQWGHMGSCNCGHLAQELTRLTKTQIHEFAMQRMGDWNDQVMEYCADSGLPIDMVIDTMLEAGITLEDIRQLEKLSNPKVLSRIPSRHLPLAKNKKQDLIIYLKTWLKILEEEWLEFGNNNTDQQEKDQTDIITKEFLPFSFLSQ